MTIQLSSYVLPYPQGYIENVVIRAAHYVSMQGAVLHDLRMGDDSAYWIHAVIKWDDLTVSELALVESAFEDLLANSNASGTGVLFRSPTGIEYTAFLHEEQRGLQVLTFTGRKESDSGPFIPLHATSISMVLK